MQTVRNLTRKYPGQFWVLLIGSFIFMLGAGLLWPFLTIYLQEKLALPLRQSTLLITLRAVSGVLASFTFAGTFADRFGRRVLMLVSIFGGILYYLGMKFSVEVWEFALLMAMWGILDILYPVGANAMVADLIPEEDRLEAYSLMKIVYNAGYAIGPILGGMMASSSYDLIFYGAAGGYAVSFVIFLLFTRETLPAETLSEAERKKEDGSILVVLRDRLYISSVFLNGLIYITSSGVFSLLSLYAQNYGIPENQVSYVFTVNAVMCVTLQLLVIRLIKGRRPLKMMCVSGLLYMIGVSSIALTDHVWWYCICIIIITFGELIMSPTMSDLAARMAPANARGRYMSVLSLARPFGQSIGPAFLGLVHDTVSPRMMWVYGSFFAGIACVIFFFMNRRIEELS